MNIKELCKAIDELKAYADGVGRTRSHCMRCKHTFDECMTHEDIPCRYEIFSKVAEELKEDYEKKV